MVTTTTKVRDSNLVWVGDGKGEDGINWNNPWGDGRPKILPQKWAQRNILPFLDRNTTSSWSTHHNERGLSHEESSRERGGRRLHLNVSGTPVIHENHAKDVVLGPRDGNRLSQLVAGANKECLQTQMTSRVQSACDSEKCHLLVLKITHHFQFNVHQFARPKHRWFL